MAEGCYTLITEIGKAKIANCIPLGTKVNFTKFKVGDGNGNVYEPTESQTDLVNTKWEGTVSSVYIDENNKNWIIVDTVIPADIGGFFVREAGIFDDENNLIAISKISESYKPTFEVDNTTKEMLIRLILEVTNTASITLKVDPTLILATKKDVQIIDAKVQSINTQLSDMIYQTAGGTATAITLTTQILVNGYFKTFIASANNSGAATTINGKPLYKPNTTAAPNLIAGKAYTVWYNASKDCFFIKASAEGTAVAENVLAGTTFSNDNDTGMPGSMTNNGAVNQSLNCGSSFIIPKGYHNGQGKVTANSLASQTGANADASKILSGFSAWVNGNLINGQASIESLGGRKYAHGTVNSDSGFTCTFNGENCLNRYIYTENSSAVTVSGLNFQPDFIYLKRVNGDYIYISIYENNGEVVLTKYDTTYGYNNDVYSARYIFQSPMYVSSTGFRIPVWDSVYAYEWFAIKR